MRFNKKLFSHSCHEFKPRAVRAQALAAEACGGACASVLRFDSSLGRNYFSPHRFRPCDTIRLLNFETNLVSAVSESLTRAALSDRLGVFWDLGFGILICGHYGRTAVPSFLRVGSQYPGVSGKGNFLASSSLRSTPKPGASLTNM